MSKVGCNTFFRHFFYENFDAKRNYQLFENTFERIIHSSQFTIILLSIPKPL
jgi:hypothetical protein